MAASLQRYYIYVSKELSGKIVATYPLKIMEDYLY